MLFVLLCFNGTKVNVSIEQIVIGRFLHLTPIIEFCAICGRVWVTSINVKHDLCFELFNIVSLLLKVEKKNFLKVLIHLKASSQKHIDIHIL